MRSPTTLPDLTVPNPLLSNVPNLFGPQTIVVVNIRNHPFRVHKNYICHYSSFFEAAFHGKFVEAQSCEMTMNNVSPRIFGLMVNWLYTNEIVDKDGKLPSCRVLVELWIMADRFIMATLQNQTLGALNLARLGGKPFASDLPSRIYESTNESSPLRSYLVDLFIEGTAGGLRDSDPPQFLVDVINGMRALSEAQKKKQGKPGKNWKPSKQRMKSYHAKESAGNRRNASQPLSKS